MRHEKRSANRALFLFPAYVPLIDTHTHLESFLRNGTADAALARAKEAGLDALVSIGTAPDDWTLYRDAARAHRGFVYFTVGVHPCSVDERWSEAVALIEDFFADADAAGPVALGETGLDRFHLPKDDEAAANRIFAWQKAAFAAQLEITRRLGCPLVVHSRGAFDDCVAMIDAAGIPWNKVVFHCFTEGPSEMEQLRSRGGFGSFTGILTYKSADSLRAAALAQGLDRLMLETDAPYLTPVPHRGKSNEPAFLRHTAEFASDLFKVPFATLAETTTANARRFYGLK